MVMVQARTWVLEMKHGVEVTDGVRSHNVSNGHRGIPNIETDTNRAVDTIKKVRMQQNMSKPPNSPIETARWRSHGPNGCGSHAEASSMQTDVHSLKMDVQSITANAKMPANESRNVRTRQIRSRTQNSPVAHEIKLPKHTVWGRSARLMYTDW